MSAKQLSVKSGTSPATVVRFTKHLGYASYLDFTEELHQMIIKDYRPMGKLGEAMDSQANKNISLQHTTFHETASISSLASLNPEISVQKTIQLLCQAKNIYITGARSAYTLVYYLGFLLKEIVHNIEYFSSSADDAYERLELGNNHDVLFIVSFRRYARSSFELAKFGQKRGLKVIGLTDVPNSPICRFCGLTLFAPNNTPFYSYTSAMSLINSIIWGFANVRGEELAESLKRRQKMLLEQDVFV